MIAALRDLVHPACTEPFAAPRCPPRTRSVPSTGDIAGARAAHNGTCDAARSIMRIFTSKQVSLSAILIFGFGLPSCVEDDEVPLAAGEQAITYTLSCQSPGTGFGAFVLPPGAAGPAFVPLTSLQSVPNPVLPVDPRRGGFVVRDDLVDYVSDLSAALQLGKALFWDIQVSSDNKVACATCHFRAGADARIRNQLHPGANAAWDGYAANAVLTATDFPFTEPPRDVDNIAGSQGVRSAAFVGIGSGGVENTSPLSDPVFGTMRQTTALNAPSVVNAVFNHRNFFNGRAQPEFNGVNPWGDRDGSAHAWVVIDGAGNIGSIDLHIPVASLASQAVGPPLNSVEMSAAGRTFPELGQKMLMVKPLGLQKIDARDGVLGSLAETRTKGLKTTYGALIQKAFPARWWSTAKTITINSRSYSLMQANFSLFFGISVMLYEATLVADQSAMDLYAASRTFDPTTGNLLNDNPALLDAAVSRLAAQGITVPLIGGGTRPVTRADILTGLDLFEKPLPLPGMPGVPAGSGVGCSACHMAAETTSASIRSVSDGIEPGDVAFKNAGFDLRMERMFSGIRTPAPLPPQPPPPVPPGSDVIAFDTATYAVTVTDIAGSPVAPQAVPVATYDTGWYNVGVRVPAEGAGLGGDDAFGRPLSWVEYYQATLTNPSLIKVPGGGLGCVDASGNPVSPPAAPLTSVFAGEVVHPVTGRPLLAGGLLRTEATDVAGTFKTPSLRNVELTGPYFHNGGKATLRQVIELYDDGGDFASATVAPLIRPLGLTEDQIVALVAFLTSLTDERVLYQRAPFDHPELPIPGGQDASGADLVTVIPAVGAGGQATPVPRFLDLNPFVP
jgi:cytochrome c peroxidase